MAAEYIGHRATFRKVHHVFQYYGNPRGIAHLETSLLCLLGEFPGNSNELHRISPSYTCIRFESKEATLASSSWLGPNFLGCDTVNLFQFA